MSTAEEPVIADRPTVQRTADGAILFALDVAWAVAVRTGRAVLRRPVPLTFSLAQPLIWMGFFGFLFQRFQWQGESSAQGAVHTYLDFLAPGVCAMTVLFGATQSGIGWIRDLQTGFLPRLLRTPAAHGAVLAGKILADVVRLLLQAGAVLVLAVLLGAHFAPTTLAVLQGIVALALFAAAVAGLSCTIALRSRTPETVALFVHLVNMPLLFTSTALVPGRQMPPWLAALAQWNPLSLCVDIWRRALLQGELSAWSQLLPLAVVAVLMGWSAQRSMDGIAALD